MNFLMILPWNVRTVASPVSFHGVVAGCMSHVRKPHLASKLPLSANSSSGHGFSVDVEPPYRRIVLGSGFANSKLGTAKN